MNKKKTFFKNIKQKWKFEKKNKIKLNGNLI